MVGRCLVVLSALLVCSCVCAVSDRMQESPKGVPCVRIPTRMHEVGSDVAQAKTFCPAVNASAAQFHDRKVFVFRGQEKSGTSVALLLLYGVMEKVARDVLGYNVQISTPRWQQSLGFKAIIYPNRTIEVHGTEYKHAATPITHVNTILTMRDPRDLVGSYWHHKMGRNAPIPPGMLAHAELQPKGMLHILQSAGRFNAPFLWTANRTLGLLPIRFSTMVSDLPIVVRQICEFFELEGLYTGPRAEEAQKVIQELADQYDRNKAQKIIKEFDQGKNVTVPSWFGETHFNGGKVKGFEEDFVQEDQTALNEYICSRQGFAALIWGVEGCGRPCAVKAANPKEWWFHCTFHGKEGQ